MIKQTNLSVRNAKNAIRGLEELCTFVKASLGEISMVEIGSFSGDSVRVFARFFHTIYSIDPWQSGYDPNDNASNPNMYDMKMVEAKFDEACVQYLNINKMKMTSADAVHYFKDESFSFIYIDGNHQEKYIREDIKLWTPKVKKGGFLGLHDYQSRHFPYVEKIVHEIFGIPTMIFKDSSCVVHIKE